MLLDKIVSTIAMSISFIGIGIILAASLKGVFDFLRMVWGENVGISDIRLELGYGIILGLEFFVAADITETVFKPNYYDLGILALIVLIRTFLSYFLNKELQELHSEKKAPDTEH